MARLRGVFVTGTDTGVGKTWIACGLISALRQRGYTVAGMKPVASGCEQTEAGLRNEDACLLQQEASFAADYQTVNPYAFAPPIAPHIAAQESGVEIRFDRIRRLAKELASQADLVVVEGVGGWRVPLGKEGDVAALAKALGLPVVLVVGVRLGCLNHAFLSARAIRDDGLTLAAWVGNRLDPQIDRCDENLQALASGVSAPCLGVIPFFEELCAGTVASYLDLDCLTP